MAETCDKCSQALPEPKNLWLTTQVVIDTYGFDPRLYETDLKSKLVSVPSAYAPGDGVAIRVWLKDSIEAKAASLAKKV
jgi:hypothetical protein